ncbi:MAG TPA: CBS domain-containing protein [Ktedonobacterales bacterium]|nr:CBS domain-containing protein [Ktedonobacterales bacterium]
MIARDIMTSQVVSVSPSAPIREVADLLAEYRISGVPVVDEQGQMLGLVTEADLISKQGKTAADIMSARVVTVQEATPVDEIAQILTSNRFKRVPVMRDERLVGIVSRADIVRMMASRWVCAVCGDIEHGRRPADCPTCGADGSHFDRELDPRPEVSQHQ